MSDWTPNLAGHSGPSYRAIADVLEADIQAGRLRPGERLPPQRRLAERLGLDFTTVARGYAQAQARGLIESRVGQGSFVRSAPTADRRVAARRRTVDLSMNLPPEPDDPLLVGRMREGVAAVSADLVALLRYQPFGGAPEDKDAASTWLGRRGLVPSQDRIAIAPGAHAALHALFGTLARPGETILADAITYPGARAIARDRGLNLVGVALDANGMDPDALGAACRAHAPRLLYLNPTLQNPLTLTVPETRRLEIVEVARRHGLQIVEDDAYGFIPPRGAPPFAALASDITWHVAGLAKCLGAGLRAAYLIAPDPRALWPVTASMRAAGVMASPLSVALATRWIEDGTADQLLRFIRRETAARQAIAAELLGATPAIEGLAVRADPLSFHLWLDLPPPWSRAAFAGQMRGTGIGVVPSDAFVVSGPATESVRVGLGGPTGREQVRSALDFMTHVLAQPPDFDLSMI